jgi:hypothetical protein
MTGCLNLMVKDFAKVRATKSILLPGENPTMSVMGFSLGTGWAKASGILLLNNIKKPINHFFKV